MSEVKQKLIIIGAGSVGKYLAYNINDFDSVFIIEGFIDDDVNKHDKMIAGYPVLGSTAMLESYSNKGYALALGIAFPTIKQSLYKQLSSLVFNYPNFISKKAWISNGVEFGKGCIVYPGTSINYECNFDDFVVINMNCAIGHNCSVSAFTSFSPGVNLGGYTTIGFATELGIGASTKQGVAIGDNCIIGGQSMVISNIESNEKVYGIPAKLKNIIR